MKDTIGGSLTKNLINKIIQAAGSFESAVFYMIKPRIKICCISSIEEAELAIKFGASAVGLVSNMPSGPGVISEDKIAEISEKIPPGVSSFLLTCKQDAASIIEQHKRCRTNTIQIVDHLLNGTYEELRDSLPGIKIVQVIHVSDENSVLDAVNISKKVDALLLDSGNQNLKIKELGGTGRIHNWDLSREVVKKASCPVYLAGGLNSENIHIAVSKVKPFGVDICSGVRTSGKLDEIKLKSFVNRIPAVNHNL